MGIPEDRQNLCIETKVHQQTCQTNQWHKTLGKLLMVVMFVGFMAWCLTVVVRQNVDIQSRLTEMEAYNGIEKLHLSGEEEKFLMLGKHISEIMMINVSHSYTSHELEQKLESYLVRKTQLSPMNGCQCSPGEKGASGEMGTQGEKGNMGNPGEKGTAGQKGAPGASGLKGDKGDVGLQGEKGDRGSAGRVKRSVPDILYGEKGQKGQKGEQ